MKVYDWKTLIVTVTIGFGLILYKLFELFNGGDLADAVEVLLFSYASYQGLKSSLTEEGYLKDKENARRSKIISQRLFGRFAPVVYSGYFILLIVSVVILFKWPEKVRLARWVFVGALLYAVVLIILTVMEEEKLKAEENRNQAKNEE